jgi:hypothetical protein
MLTVRYRPDKVMAARTYIVIPVLEAIAAKWRKRHDKGEQHEIPYVTLAVQAIFDSRIVLYFTYPGCAYSEQTENKA